MEPVELGALLHDVFDWKYSGSDKASSEAADELLTSLVRAPPCHTHVPVMFAPPFARQATLLPTAICHLAGW